jgi:MOSC domain-containing protein YiiM
MEILKELLSTNTFQGKVDWIGISSGPRSEIKSQDSVRIVTGGVEGDHHCRPTRKSKRQVTLIQAEHIPVVEAILGRGKIDPSLLRRNIVVSGINLAALKYQTFRIGTAVLEGSGNCPPCSRMEENLGPGGYASMLAHGGITAVVVSEGVVSLGDTVSALPMLYVG